MIDADSDPLRIKYCESFIGFLKTTRIEYKTWENENMIYVENRKKSMKMNRSMLEPLILSKGKLLVRAKGSVNSTGTLRV